MSDLRSGVWRWAVAVGVLTTGWALIALPARATYGARLTADEPQYVLSAISLAEDGDLTISDELDEQRWREFHEALLPVQTRPLPDGREVSPHNPLLAVLLAPGAGVGGWVGAKATLAVLAGILAAATVWVAVRRLGVAPSVAAVVVAAFSLSAPLTAYATQVYPELPAALAVLGGIAALTGPLRRRGLVLGGAAIVALPWLGTKYAPVAVVLTGLVVARLGADRRWRALGLWGAALVAAGAVHAGAHLAIYTGLTPYSAGDHFVGGELTVMGNDPDRLGRTIRVLGLWVDRDFGLVAWAPVFLLGPPALAALARRRPPGWVVLGAVVGAGWVTATWVALTMHGWWWPGRQVVHVLPALVLAVAWWASQVRAVVPVAAASGAVGMLTWGWLVAEVRAGRRTLVVDFAETGAPWFKVMHPLLPDGRAVAATRWGFVAWAVVLVGLGAVGWRSVGGPSVPGSVHSGRGDEDAGAGEAADAHVAPTQLDGDGAVG